MPDDILGIIAPHPPIMVPEVGGERSRVTEASARALGSAARLLEEFAPDAIVLMSPHAPVSRDAFLIDDSETLTGDLGSFGAPGVSFRVRGDRELADAILTNARDHDLPLAPRSASVLLEPGMLDHGAMVPLYFLDRLSRIPLVLLSLAFLPLPTHRELGRAVRLAARGIGRRVAFVASGDCSHRLTRDAPAGYAPQAAEFDARLVELLSRGDYESLEHIDASLIEAAGECGLRSFVALGGFIEGGDARTRVLAYEGPWGVGYLTAVATTPALIGVLEGKATDTGSARETDASDDIDTGDPDESAPVRLARATIEAYVRGRRVIDPPHEPEGVLGTRHGAFVSLHRGGELRGCIGTIGPTMPTLAEEIVHNAIQAATADPRFEALTPDELDDLEISVDVLHEAEPATMADLDPSAYGVIVTADWRRGLLLPDLDGVDTAGEQVSIALRKAGIDAGEHYHLERFRVDRFH